jgi:UDP-galactopyranose mutase
MEWRHFDQNGDDDVTVLTREYPQDWDCQKRRTIQSMMRRIQLYLNNTVMKRKI